jgi:hypothetical protein
MAETLGSLCDKLTVVNLKIYHSTDESRLASLAKQANQLKEEINNYLSQVLCGIIPLDAICFDSNKVYNRDRNQFDAVSGSIGEIFSTLAEVNCLLWHEQEKVYEFESVLDHEKNSVIKKLAQLNLKRNDCIDKINKKLREKLETLTETYG